MSSSEGGPRGFTALDSPRAGRGPDIPLEVEALQSGNDLSYDTRIVVLDGWDETRAEGYGRVAVDLPRGLYTVRLERGGATREEVIRHAGPEPAPHRFPLPLRDSALPSFDTSDAHEYYTDTAVELSRRDTGKAAQLLGTDGSGNPRLFLFLRKARAAEQPAGDLAEALYLYDSEGRLLTDFSAEFVERDDAHGWLAFSAPIRPGTYLLRHAGLDTREMAIRVFPHWDTQLFIPYRQRPRLARASLMLAPTGAGFHPDDPLTQAVDAALAGLQSGTDTLPREARNQLLGGKFDNPMLGLIGAHLLLLRERPDRGLLDIVLGNLDHLLPGSVDVQALRIARALRFDEPPPATPIAQPPLLRRGLDAVLEATAIHPEIVPQGGSIERIAPHLLADSPWSLWTVPGRVANLSAEVEALADRVLAQASRRKDFSRPTRRTARSISGAVQRAAAPLLEKLVRGAATRLPDLTDAVLPELLRRSGAVRPGLDPSLHRVISDSLQREVDILLSRHPEQAQLPQTDGEIPEWVRRLLDDTLARSRARGQEPDLAALARQTKLPLAALQRWMKQK